MSFEKSLIVVQHVYRPEEFKELRGFISIHALDLILGSCSHAVHVSHANENRCSCAIRRTHGLPCGHEIARYRKEGRPIPLSCIHDHWKKLTIDHPSPVVESSCRHEIELLEKRLERSDEQTRQHIRRKIRELALPETTSLMEP